MHSSIHANSKVAVGQTGTFEILNSETYFGSIRPGPIQSVLFRPIYWTDFVARPCLSPTTDKDHLKMCPLQFIHIITAYHSHSDCQCQISNRDYWKCKLCFCFCFAAATIIAFVHKISYCLQVSKIYIYQTFLRSCLISWIEDCNVDITKLVSFSATVSCWPAISFNSVNILLNPSTHVNLHEK